VHRWDPERRAALDAYHVVLAGRPSVARVIDAARPYRELFPLPWPDHVD
jgi:glutathione S-transferase